MKFPRPRIRLRTAAGVIAHWALILLWVLIPALFFQFVLIPLWEYYNLPPKTRDVLARLDRPFSAASGAPTPLGAFLKTIRIVSEDGGGANGIPVSVEPAGLNEARATITSPVALGTDQAPLRVHLRRALEPLGLSYYVLDGMLTITSKQAADRALRQAPRRARRP